MGSSAAPQGWKEHNEVMIERMNKMQIQIEVLQAEVDRTNSSRSSLGRATYQQNPTVDLTFRSHAAAEGVPISGTKDLEVTYQNLSELLRDTQFVSPVRLASDVPGPRKDTLTKPLHLAATLVSKRLDTESDEFDE
jgi:hypothetical protein